MKIVYFCKKLFGNMIMMKIVLKSHRILWVTYKFNNVNKVSKTKQNKIVNEKTTNKLPPRPNKKDNFQNGRIANEGFLQINYTKR